MKIQLIEQIVTTDYLLTSFNMDVLNVRKLDRIVDLACGHKARTSAVKRARCTRCEEMLRRSMENGSEDYDSFRKGLIPDRMEWKEDPLRNLHENYFKNESN